MNDPLIPERLLRALRYVDMVERGGGQLTDSKIEAFVSTPPPEPGFLLSTERRLMRSFMFVQTEGIAEYMRDLGWISGQPPRLTDVGRAIVNASHRDDGDLGPEEHEGETVVLSPEDPLNLLSLTGAVGAAKSGMLVDPYFKDDYVLWLLESTSIERLLLCRARSERSRLALAAGAAEKLHRRIEIRCLPRSAVHDRYLISEDGSVSMIGASINGLHKHFTVIARVNEPGSSAIREYVERKWTEAEKIKPKADLSTSLTVAPGEDPGATNE